MTIEAAQKFYHKGQAGPYMINKDYSGPKDSVSQLEEGKAKI